MVVRGMSSRLQVARDAKAEQTGLGLEIRNITDLFKKDTMIFFLLRKGLLFFHDRFHR